MTVAAFLNAVFRLDTKEAEASMSKIKNLFGQELQGKFDQFTGKLGVVGKGLQALGPAGTVAAAAIGALTAAATYSLGTLVQMGDRLTNLSRQFEISTDSLQKLEYAGQGMGISLEKLASQSQKLERTLGSPAGLKALKELGLEYSKLSALPADERMLKVYEALSKIEDPLKRNALLFQTMGRSAEKLSQEQLKELIERYGEFNGVSEEALKAGDALGDTWQDLKSHATVLAAEVAGPLASGLNLIIKYFTDADTKAGSFRETLKQWNEEYSQYGFDSSNMGGGAGSVTPTGGAAALGAAGFATMDSVAAWLNPSLGGQPAPAGGGGAPGFNPLITGNQRFGLTGQTPGIAAAGSTDITSMGLFQNNLDVSSRDWNLQGQAPNVDFFKDAAPALDYFAFSLEQASQFTQIFGGSLGSLSDILNIATRGSAAGGMMREGLDAGGVQGMMTAGMGAVAGGMNVWNATGTGGRGRRVGQGALAGASAGAAFGPIGAGVGAAAGAIVGALRTDHAGDLMEDVGRDFGTTLTREMAQAIHDSGKPVHESLTELFDTGTMSIDRYAEEVGDLFSMFERDEISRGTLMSELAEDLPLLIENFEDLGDVGQENLERIMQAAEDMGVDLGMAGEQLERMQAGIIEMTSEDLMEKFGMTAEQLQLGKDTLGLNVQSRDERVADEFDVSMEFMQGLGPILESLGLSIQELPEFLEATNMDFEEFVKGVLENDETLTEAQKAEYQKFLEDAQKKKDEEKSAEERTREQQERSNGHLSNIERLIDGLPEQIGRVVGDFVSRNG